MTLISGEIYPLFSSPIFIMNLEECLDDFYNKFKNEYDFTKTKSFETSQSKSKNILNNHLELKEIILNYFNLYKDNILKYESTDFEITTSWITKTSKEAQSKLHNHRNCCFSGILYFDTIENGGKLRFDDTGLTPSSFLLNNPSEFNIYNSQSWRISPKKNMIVFFPSYLYHQIETNNSNIIRYSLAFNIMPINTFGHVDSKVNLKVLPISKQYDI
jgi:uncharacterized protein (TIGR02466 family)